MERLTEKVLGNIQLKACGNDFCKETCAEHDEEKSCNNCPIQKAFEKLAEYEDLEEQGKLLKLPCKIGDMVYTACSWGIETGVAGSIEIISDRIFVNNISGQMIGEASNIFLTRQEAEDKLAEMEGGEWKLNIFRRLTI